MMSNACGVDFDTSNSTVGWLRLDAPTLLPFGDGKATLSSVIFLHVENPTVSYGRAALADYLAGYEGCSMRSLKSLLGTSMMDDSTKVMDQAMPFRKLLAHFIGELKRRAEHVAGHEFHRAVLGRPVFFIDEGPKAGQLAEDTLADVARDAGSNEIVFQYEPIATAFDHEADISGEELVLVADIGGGTSDFSLVRLSPDRAKRFDRRNDILTNDGVHIGGTDFDRALSLASVMPLLGLNSTLRNGKATPSDQYFDLTSWHTINHVYTRKAWAMMMDNYRDVADTEKPDRLTRLICERAGHWLAIQVEAAKIALSDAPVAEIDLHRIAPELKQFITHEDFDQSTGKLVGKTVSTMQAMLETAGVAAEKVDTILFAGGSSGVPLLREQLAQVLPSARRVEGDLFDGIGSGLARDAVRKFG